MGVVLEVDVWLEAGREGRTFTYKDSRCLGVDIGDIVLVRLRGREKKGLVVNKKYPNLNKENAVEILSRQINLLEVEDLIQSAAVDSRWHRWLLDVAVDCHSSSFRMLKTALPSSWLSNSSLNYSKNKSHWRIELTNNEPNIKISKRQSELYFKLQSLGKGSWQRDLFHAGFSYSTIKVLVDLGLVKRFKMEINDSYSSKVSNRINNSLEADHVKVLNQEQQNALCTFESLPKGSSLLLWGVTGSGKTEVYLQISQKEIISGRSCLILTPEIGLIPQLVDRFRRRFGVRVLEYHSGCSEREKINVWKKIINNKDPLIIVGTRSAIFLPLSNLGLIVIDEEHDSSYKQESPMPCYHARELAKSRAHWTGAKVVLGSATPSLNTWKDLSPYGPIILAKLTKRISNSSLPSVVIVDMRKEFSAGNKTLISRALKQRLNKLIDTGEQAVVLVPKRGYSSFLSCRSCGEVVQCKNCDVAMTVHKNSSGSQWLRCHWCDSRSSFDSSCNECGSYAFKPFGAGTQRVIEHLSRELPNLKFLRFDRDTTRGRDGHRDILKKFSSGEADVLVGTQMLAKGIDLPAVTLAVVLAADGLLHRPDLMASEKSLQLFMQLAGRAGRGNKPGEVLVQTYCPDHPVIEHLVDGRYEEFLRKEKDLRKEAGMVPFRRACLIRLAGESASLTANTAVSIASQLKCSSVSNGWELIGPAPSVVSRVAGKVRWQILLHGPINAKLPLPAGNELWEKLPRGITLSVDPDPLQL
tara:strand:- start:643 stop:2901 length:2259 start_codon:yes stop_codon:yes gene_type:complete